MTVQRTGIPTTFQHQNFRSRLEARWAAFFDLIGWSWIYEPYDLNGYIPDFLVMGKAPFLVEVKPAATFEELVLVGSDLNRRGVYEELSPDPETGDSGKDLLIVGATPIIEPFSDGWVYPVLGLSMMSSVRDDQAIWWSTNPFVWMEDGGNFGLRPTGGDRRDVGNFRFISPKGWGYDEDSLLVESHWREAGNQVQWHKR